MVAKLPEAWWSPEASPLPELPAMSSGGIVVAGVVIAGCPGLAGGIAIAGIAGEEVVAGIVARRLVIAGGIAIARIAGGEVVAGVAVAGGVLAGGTVALECRYRGGRVSRSAPGVIGG